jgi:predicted nucleic acid-binding protein
MPETGVIAVVCDASVVLKWFHSAGESEVSAARAILAAQREGRVYACILDLTLYEVGNILLRKGWPAGAVGDQLDDLRALCSVIAPTETEHRLAAQIGRDSRLTYYDAAYAAVARSRGAALATDDPVLLRAGLWESPVALANRLRLAGSI